MIATRTAQQLASKITATMTSGDEYFARRDYIKALEEYSEVINMDANYVPAYLGRGRTYMAYGKASPTLNLFNAIGDFTKALALDPTNADAYRYRGDVQQCLYLRDLMCRPEAAIYDYTQAINLNPRCAELYASRARLYYAIPKDGEVIHDYTKALDIDDNKAGIRSALFYHIANKKKNDILNLIKALSPDKQIYLLKKSLDKKTILGQRFWKAEGTLECNLRSGTLKEIGDLLRKLTKPDGPAPMGSKCLFFNYNIKRRQRYPVLNPVVDDKLFQL